MAKAKKKKKTRNLKCYMDSLICVEMQKMAMRVGSLGEEDCLFCPFYSPQHRGLLLPTVF